ncbi:MAG: hypothetical protein ABSF34_06050 [Verrucomicrobiota bacterium]
MVGLSRRASIAIRVPQNQRGFQEIFEINFENQWSNATEILHFALSPARQYAHRIFSDMHETMRDLPEGALLLTGIVRPDKLHHFYCKLQPDISLHLANCLSFFGDSLNSLSFNKKNYWHSKS